MEHLKVAYITVNDPLDKNSWSGLEYYAARTIGEQIGDITYISNLTYRRSLIHHAKRFYYKLRGKTYFAERSKEIVLHYAREVEKRLEGSGCDLIFSPSTIPIAYLETAIPIAVWLDATFAVMVDYYFKNLCQESIHDGNTTDINAFKRCSYICFASQWAAASAVREYNIDKERIRVIPFGANIDVSPEKEAFVDRPTIPLHLLFIARDWYRKGGAKVFQIFEDLNNMGIESNLSVIGCIPPKRYRHVLMRIFPFLDKNVQQDAEQLDQLYRRANFLLLPSRQECYGLVLCEANAYGVPVLASDTGGIPEIVKDGFNGYLMPVNASPKDYVQKIAHLIRQKKMYFDMCKTARRRFEEVLNWQVSGRSLKSFISADTC
jgi:glycosyltransferase involved in cell wall biosynthesis